MQVWFLEEGSWRPTHVRCCHNNVYIILQPLLGYAMSCWIVVVLLMGVINACKSCMLDSTKQCAWTERLHIKIILSWVVSNQCMDWFPRTYVLSQHHTKLVFLHGPLDSFPGIIGEWMYHYSFLALALLATSCCTCFKMNSDQICCRQIWLNHPMLQVLQHPRVQGHIFMVVGVSLRLQWIL